jgi:hypothetical protein
MRRAGWTMATLALVTMAACQKAAGPVSNAAATPTNAAAPTSNAAVANTALAAASSDAADAKAFVESLYTHYGKGESETSNWAPFDADAPKVLDPSLAALFKAYDKAMNGELGDIEDDWICQCQDWEKINATVVVDSATSTTAKVRSTFQDTADHVGPKHDTFDLVKTPDGWRIHDMGADNDKSLRAVLEKAIAEAKAHPPAPDNDAAP